VQGGSGGGGGFGCCRGRLQLATVASFLFSFFPFFFSFSFLLSSLPGPDKKLLKPNLPQLRIEDVDKERIRYKGLRLSDLEGGLLAAVFTLIFVDKKCIFLGESAVPFVDSKYFCTAHFCSLSSFITGSSVIVWKQPDRIISAGDRLIRKDERMKLVREPSGISLYISSVQPEDRGEHD
jgi:hypothetical protein